MVAPLKPADIRISVLDTGGHISHKRLAAGDSQFRILNAERIFRVPNNCCFNFHKIHHLFKYICPKYTQARQ